MKWMNQLNKYCKLLWEYIVILLFTQNDVQLNKNFGEISVDHNLFGLVCSKTSILFVYHYVTEKVFEWKSRKLDHLRI